MEIFLILLKSPEIIFVTSNVSVNVGFTKFERVFSFLLNNNSGRVMYVFGSMGWHDKSTKALQNNI